MLSGDVQMDESYVAGKRAGKRRRGAEGKISLFGLIEREGKVKLKIVKDVSAEGILKENIKKVKRGNIGACPKNGLVYKNTPYATFELLCSYHTLYESITINWSNKDKQL